VSILRRRPLVEDAAALPEEPGPSVESEAATHERLHQLVDDLQALSHPQRAALVMRELSGLSYAEIGEALEISETRSRQVVYEARAALRDLDRGREMACEEVRQALSTQDGRILRGRRLRAHLRTCEGCQAFRAATEQRRGDLEALCPPLPAVASTLLIGSVLSEAEHGGGGAAAGSAAAIGGAGGGSGAGAVGSVAVSTVVKGASILVAGTLGAATAGMTRVVDTPWTPSRVAGEPGVVKPTQTAGRFTPVATGTSPAKGAAEFGASDPSPRPSRRPVVGGTRPEATYERPEATSEPTAARQDQTKPATDEDPQADRPFEDEGQGNAGDGAQGHGSTGTPWGEREPSGPSGQPPGMAPRQPPKPERIGKPPDAGAPSGPPAQPPKPERIGKPPDAGAPSGSPAPPAHPKPGGPPPNPGRPGGG
jgi:hypothetical protein